MMKSVFADTGYRIALVNPRDQDHSRAVEVAATLRGIRIVTSEWVLFELLNGVAESGHHLRSAAANTVSTLKTVPGSIVDCQSENIFSRALKLYSERIDKQWSLTDCASFLIMEKLGIDSALTADHHFQQAGFTALLR